MTGKVVVANGMFRSGSTFFFDVMRKSNSNVCFYEPFHPKLQELVGLQHKSSLGHSIEDSPWSEHIEHSKSSEYYNYSAHLPQHIKNNMGYYCPLCVSVQVSDYFASLPLMASSLNKNVIACFNRAGFILIDTLNRMNHINTCVVYTKRPSIQIAISFLRLYSLDKTYNLFTREFRDPWGVSLLFHHHYTEFSPLYMHNSLPSSLYSFLAKVCYLNMVIDQSMSQLADFIFDISSSLESYRTVCENLMEALGDSAHVSSARTFLDLKYRCDSFPPKISRHFFGSYDTKLLESVSFSEFQ